MLTIDDARLLADLDALLETIAGAAEQGLSDGAARMQEDLQATTAHGDVSGATRASYRAFVVGGRFDGSAEAASGYAAAAEKLADAAHGGQPLRQDSGIVLADDERGILLTSYTDYQDALETELGGEKAALGPTLLQDADLVTQLVAARSREALG